VDVYTLVTDQTLDESWENSCFIVELLSSIAKIDIAD